MHHSNLVLLGLLLQLRGPDPIPIGRARFKPLIFHWVYDHFDNDDGGSAAEAQFPQNH